MPIEVAMAKNTRRIGGKLIRYVDGFAIRNRFPDMDIVASPATSGDRQGGIPTPFIPDGEIWVDRRFRKETAFLLEVHRIEQRKRAVPYPKVRAYLKERLTRKGTPPPFIVRSSKRGRLTVRYVRGEIVRRYFDPCFIFGGHDLIYDYVPKNEVWLDVRQDPRELPITLFHELTERSLMKKGWSYRDAHAEATVRELRLRRRALKARRYRPLRMKPFRQTAGLCGPASLKIACSFFGREYDEAYLAKLSGGTPELGTDHDGLVSAAKALGATVEAGPDGTIRLLQRLVSVRRLPVIVGWYSPSTPRKTRFDPAKDEVEDHFSVVYHVTDSHVHLMDPETGSGRKKMAIGRFLKLWWDTDGPNDERVDRWYMSIDFSGKKP